MLMKKLVYLWMLYSILTISNLQAQEKLESAPDSVLTIEEGIASYYGRFFHNRRTANGEIFDMEGMTAAHKHLPFGTRLRVTNLQNGKEVIVRINDRLPQNSRRTIDLAKGAARKLGMIQMGLAPVHLSVLEPEAVANLMDYYEEIPESLRLRLYYTPIDFEKDSSMIFGEMTYGVSAGN